MASVDDIEFCRAEIAEKEKDFHNHIIFTVWPPRFVRLWSGGIREAHHIGQRIRPVIHIIIIQL